MSRGPASIAISPVHMNYKQVVEWTRLFMLKDLGLESSIIVHGIVVHALGCETRLKLIQADEK